MSKLLGALAYNGLFFGCGKGNLMEQNCKLVHKGCVDIILEAIKSVGIIVQMHLCFTV